MHNPSKMKYEKIIETIKGTSDMPAEQAIETLVECAKKGIALASVRAVRAIGELNHVNVVQSLINLYLWTEEDPYKRDKSCDIRSAIAEVFANKGTTSAADVLCKAVRTVQVVRQGATPEDVAIGLRATAAVALAKLDPSCLYELSLLLFDEKPDAPTSPINRIFVKAPVRKAAAQAIGILGEPGGAVLLATKLKFSRDEVAEVLAECLESLIFMRPPYFMEVVKPYLTCDDEYLVAITALSLAENLGTETLDLLLETLENIDDNAKEAVVVAISVIRGSGIRQILFDFLEHPNRFVRRGAVKGIKSYLDDEVLEKLQQIHNTDPDNKVRQEAGNI